MNIVLTGTNKIDQAFDEIIQVASNIGPPLLGGSNSQDSDDSVNELNLSSRAENSWQRKHFYGRILVDSSDHGQDGPLVGSSEIPTRSPAPSLRIVDQLADQVADSIVSSLVKSRRK